MAELQLTLTPDERDFLAKLLGVALKQKRVEEHRTRAPQYREHMLKEEEMLQTMLTKLGQPQEQAIS